MGVLVIGVVMFAWISGAAAALFLARYTERRDEHVITRAYLAAARLADTPVPPSAGPRVVFVTGDRLRGRSCRCGRPAVRGGAP